MALVFAALSSPLLAQPPDVVLSDADANTAMGTDALLNVVVTHPIADEVVRNTGVGTSVLMSGSFVDMTAVGAYSMSYNFGAQNTAFGAQTLNARLSSTDDSVALGYAALAVNVGNDDTALGSSALSSNTSGSSNTAVGMDSLLHNDTGSNNVAVGYLALGGNTSGNDNTAVGIKSLLLNTVGNSNSASGSYALQNTTTGSFNTAVGNAALTANAVGSDSTAFGRNALYLDTGDSNVGFGTNAGYNLTSGTANIDIGHQGMAAESATMRVGTPSTQSRVFVAGVTNTHLTGGALVVSATGQLGVLASSERYKTDIAPLSPDDSRVLSLRPVSFQLRENSGGPVQYGLIAEQVDTVLPALVVRGSAGRIEGVRYDELAPLLLEQIQHQGAELAAQAASLQIQARRLAIRDAQIHDMQRQLSELDELNSRTAHFVKEGTP